MIIKDLRISYTDNVVFDGLNIELIDGEITCIMGRSGCGKTTLLQAICGRVNYDGSIQPRPDKLSYVFQQPTLIDNVDVYHNLSLVMGKDKDADAKIRTALERMKLSGYEKRFPSGLSGGEKSRVSLARAYCYGANLMLMDEPFRALDVGLKYEIIDDFVKAKEVENTTVVFVTHDVDEALLVADRIIVLGATSHNCTDVVLDCHIDLSRNLRKVGDIQLSAIRQNIFDALLAQSSL
ncbi:MAG: ABC transporter ATP-binding protein [Christensenellales bacterium]